MVEWSWLFGIVACAISVASFVNNKQYSAKKTGVETATLSVDITYLKDAVSDIKRMLEREQDAKREELRSLKLEFDAALRRVESEVTKVLDEHTRTYHG